MKPISLRTRTPEEAVLLRRIARAMKTTPKVEETLRTALDALEAAYAMRLPAGFSDLPGTVVHLQAMLAGVEKRLARLEANQAADGAPARTPATGPNAWVTGTGSQRRLTDEGKVEFARRVAQGDTNRAIADAFGLSDSSVRSARAKLAARLAGETEPLTRGEGKQRRLTEAGQREMKRRLEEGWTDEQFIELFKLGPRTIRQLRMKLSPVRNGAETGGAPDAPADRDDAAVTVELTVGKRGRHLTPEERAQVVELAATTELSGAEIARRLGVNKETACRAIRRHRAS